MRRSTILSLLAISSLLVPALAGAAVAQEAPAVASDGLRARAEALLREAGADPAPFLAAQVQLDFLGPEPMALGDALDRLDALFPSVHSDGIAGTPELTAGDFFHTFFDVRIGSAPAGYVVTPSSVVPSTPALLTPEDAFFDVGGPLVTITGSWEGGSGFHSAGTITGSNVDTHDSGPYVPLVTGGVMVQDYAIEFRGHANVSQTSSCLFGLCTTFGTMVATGVAVWETLPVQTPAVP